MAAAKELVSLVEEDAAEAERLSRRPPDAASPHHGGRQHEVGLVGFTTWGHTDWALGVGRRVLDELAAIARERCDGRLAESATNRAAPAFVYDSWALSTMRRQPTRCQALSRLRSFASPCGTSTTCGRTSENSPPHRARRIAARRSAAAPPRCRSTRSPERGRVLWHCRTRQPALIMSSRNLHA